MNQNNLIHGGLFPPQNRIFKHFRRLNFKISPTMVDNLCLKSVFLDISEEWISKFSPTMVDILRLKTVLLEISE